VPIAGTDATSAIELAATAPLVAHQLVDYPGWNAGVLEPGREGVAKVVRAVRIDLNKVTARASDSVLVDTAEVALLHLAITAVAVLHQSP
jgi:hypothetical protein